MAKVRCSIELEPRTLNVVQLNYAREMAADVIQNSVESIETSATFIEEMRQMGSKKEMEELVIIVDEESKQQQNKLVELRDQKDPPICEGIICKCLCAAAEIETPDQEKLKEPVSAPF